MSRLLALYPKAWRDRYGDELVAVLELRPLTARDRLDLLRGAFDAHLHPELVDPAARVNERPETPSEGFTMPRRLGIATLVGAVAWIAVWIVQSLGPIVVEPDGTTYRDGAAGLPVLLAAAALLVAGLIGQLMVMPPSARLAKAGALIAIPGVLLWSLGPWVLLTAVAAIIGLGLLAIGSATARIWPLPASGALLAMVVSMPIIALSALGLGPSLELTPPLLAFVALPTLAWLAIGATLVWPRQPATERA
jgi:hypothetical protein